MKEKDEILAKTDGGLDIFVHYLGKECLRKKFRSHMREDDKHPSCKLYRNQALDGRSYYYLHDFGDSRFRVFFGGLLCGIFKRGPGKLGSGGKEIALNVAERLGIPCYERQILQMASEYSGVAEAELLSA